MERTVRVRLQAQVDGLVAPITGKAVAAIDKLEATAVRAGKKIDTALGGNISKSVDRLGTSADSAGRKIDGLGDRASKGFNKLTKFVDKKRRRSTGSAPRPPRPASPSVSGWVRQRRPRSTGSPPGPA